jgi:hypothetical protein
MIPLYPGPSGLASEGVLVDHLVAAGYVLDVIDTSSRGGVACVVVLAAWLGGCDGSEPIISEDWESSLVEIRDCRLGPEHGLEFVRLLVDEGSVDQFETCTADPEACSEPFPEGALFVKPQYADQDCTELVRISATMREVAASSPGNEGWRWQELDADRRVELDGQPSACTSCHDHCAGFDTRCAMDP